ncbi:putative surface protein with fasciclin (FAS1) repeats [Pedobacter cryoconitis]|uniref:Putative surface protein with fasciclin (FAS1) repeats n=1 Tax=Pedobacter cryoconitis TaxID=188932 RepID=A0A7W8ZLB0_9SPHI|nr:fasciclin domain-containing protein [Pedobacter cryoconitis]MBB5636132.1 putative surface protein with fasciclin (FAS1) repeats [Pedobacter cryoconitis]
MNTRKSIKKLLLLIPVLLLLFNSCKHEDLEIAKENENFRLASDFIKNNYDMSLFYAAIEKAGMKAQLQGPGPFTVLVPNNLAFQQIGISRPSDFDKMNQDSLKSLVQRHVLNYRLLTRDIPLNGVDIRYLTLAGEELYTTSSNFNPKGFANYQLDLFFNGAAVVKEDVNLANGALHVINKVMKYTPKSTVQDWLAKRPQYSIFVSGLKKFGLWDKLATAGPFTVFAPQNKEFEASNITEASIAALNTKNYNGKRLFGGYVMDKKHFFISDFFAFKFINDETVFIRKVDDDNWLMIMNSASDSFNRLNTLTLNLRTPVDFYTNYNTIYASTPGLSDNLTDNGLVHDVQGLLLLPEQALINNSPNN